MYSANPKGLNYYTTDEEEDEEEYYERKYRGRYSYPPKPKIHKDNFKPKNNAFDMQLQRFGLFKAQDVRTGHFDVIFEIDEKRIFGHKFILTSSEPLTSMLSDRWCNKDAEAVKIETYSYDNFYQFLCFLYSGKCHLTTENVFVLTDMSEFYGIPTLKGFCDEWLSKRKEDIDEKNVYEFIEIAQRYSLEEFLGTIERIFNRNLGVFLRDELFLSVKKDVVKVLSKFKRKDKQEEVFFEAACKWAEHQATAKQATEDDDPSTQSGGNFQEAIKAELSGVLSNIDFSQMTLESVVRFIADGKGYLFSASELYKVLLSSKRSPNQEEDFFKAVYKLAEKEALKKQETNNEEIFDLTAAIKTELAPLLPNVKFHQMSEKFLTEFVAAKGILSRDDGMHAHDICVQVRNADKILTGTFKDDLKIFDRVQKWEYGFTKISHKSETKQRFFNLKCSIPSTPSTVQKMKGCQWYLCLEKDGVVTVKFHTMITTTDYLIAELKSANSDFRIVTGRYTYLTATRGNMF